MFATLRPQLGQLNLRVFPEAEDARTFDGEAHIEKNLLGWDARDLLLLDPFAMWRQAEHQPQRDRYRKIIDQLISQGESSALFTLFWTWGRAFPAAQGDLNGTGPQVRNGYQELREQLHLAGRHFIRVSWRWGLQFAMWVLVPDSHLTGLFKALQRSCNALRDHLLRGECRGQLSSPNVQVVID